MRKLSLAVESLAVESFATVPEMGRSRGTVEANSYTVDPYPSCARTCGASPPPNTEICEDERPTLKACCL